jgi:hypothetical protein
MVSGHSPPAEAANLHSLCIAPKNDVSFCLELRFRSNQGNGQRLLWVDSSHRVSLEFCPYPPAMFSSTVEIEVEVEVEVE